LKCIHCGTENPDELLFCVGCGQPLKKSEPENEPELETEIESDEVFEVETDAEVEEAPKKKSPIGLIITVGVVAVALVVMVLILVRHAIPSADAPAEDNNIPLTGEVITPDANGGSANNTVAATPAHPVTAYTSPALVPAEAMETQVATFGQIGIQNWALNYYYWGEFNYLNNYYGSALYQFMDPSKPLGEQGYNGATDYTWQDALLENAVGTIEETYALIQLARENNFGLTEDDAAYIGQMLEQLRSAAAQYGYNDLDSYLQSAYGSTADEETFKGFMEDSLLASNYANQLYNSFSYTEDEIRAYYDAGDYAASGLAQDDVRNIDVRHILIQTRVDDNGVENWEATLAEAEEILGLWSSSPSEEHFAALAEEYTEDPGSQATGGLYTGVYQGQMVPAFNDWCFDASRQPGDTGIVQTNYGYHIMYFVGQAERPAWMETVEADMRGEAYSNAVAAAVAQHGFEIDYSAVVLDPPVGMYE